MDGNQNGRFIKKNSELSSIISLEDFSFDEILDSKPLFHDNMGKSIIHSKYHNPNYIDEAVVKPKTFEDDFRNGSRPVLKPLDFTAEWERNRKRNKGRSSRGYDDDDFDYGFSPEDLESVGAAPVNSEKKVNDGNAAAASSDSTPDGDRQIAESTIEHSDGNGSDFDPVANEIDPVDEMHAAGEMPITDSTEISEEEVQGPAQRTFQSMDIVGKAIQELNVDESEAVDSSGGAFEPNQSPSAGAINPANGFVPDKQYQNTVPQADLSGYADQLESAKREAEAEGYAEGYAQGEEKATLQSSQKIKDMFGKISELVEEFKGLRSDILEHAQQNFYDVCQALAENIIQRELRIDPSAFNDLVKKALKESLPGDEIKIKVHSEIAQALRAIDDEQVTKYLIVDDSVEPGDFKLESSLSVVEGKLSDIVSGLLEKADLDLYETQDNKAG